MVLGKKQQQRIMILKSQSGILLGGLGGSENNYPKFSILRIFLSPFLIYLIKTY